MELYIENKIIRDSCALKNKELLKELKERFRAKNEDEIFKTMFRLYLRPNASPELKTQILNHMVLLNSKKISSGCLSHPVL